MLFLTCVRLCPTGGELILPIITEDAVEVASLVTRSPFVAPAPTYRPQSPGVQATRESLSVPGPDVGPCLSGRDDDCDEVLVASGLGSGELFDSSFPPSDDEDFYSLVTDRTLLGAAPGTVASPPRSLPVPAGSPPSAPIPTSSSPDMIRKLPAGKLNTRDHPRLPALPTQPSGGRQARRPSVTDGPRLPTAGPSGPGAPGAVEVIRESSSTTGMVVGIVAAAALCILILLYAMYKYRNRDEGSYQVDQSRNYISNSAQSNGALLKDKPACAAASAAAASANKTKGKRNKDKEYYV